METENKPPTPEEIRAGIQQMAEGLRRGAALGKELYEKERRPEDPPWEQAAQNVRQVYITCAVHAARSAGNGNG